MFEKEGETNIQMMWMGHWWCVRLVLSLMINSNGGQRHHPEPLNLTTEDRDRGRRVRHVLYIQANLPSLQLGHFGKGW